MDLQLKNKTVLNKNCLFNLKIELNVIIKILLKKENRILCMCLKLIHILRI